MRQLCVLCAFLLSATLAACADPGTAGDDTTGDDTVDPPEYGFQIVTPDIEVGAGVETTKCFYTTVDSADDLGVKLWSSTMTPGSHHMIVYTTNAALAPDGTVDDCQAADSGGGGLAIPTWTYAAQNQVADMALPDGVGMLITAQQHLYIQMHYLNAGTAALQAHVTLTAEAYAPEESYTRAAAYVTYNTEIDLAPGETATFGGTCAIPAGAKFFTLSTHAHKRSTHTQVQDGTPVVFQSDNWEEPGRTDWLTDNYAFEAGSLTYSCTYTNTESFRVTEGQSAQTNEMCMAVGYFYPATGPKFCLNSLVVQ